MATEAGRLASGEFPAPRRYLSLHGVRHVHQHPARAGTAPGDVILSAAMELGADLLVMGCYGHTRAREWIFGGASRTVLSRMHLPVLMSH